eukprot:TRINITY_DN570_c3_g1_i1.p1 TRINITY_DN570_c3_g1~~TRINITY_DN570_c3_g1_i1.p1  ORF type:complete len:656 (-),score=195.01 TRINITY_DN570_c3_g1_i1:44-2011(-)
MFWGRSSKSGSVGSDGNQTGSGANSFDNEPAPIMTGSGGNSNNNSSANLEPVKTESTKNESVPLPVLPARPKKGLPPVPSNPTPPKPTNSPVMNRPPNPNPNANITTPAAHPPRTPHSRATRQSIMLQHLGDFLSDPSANAHNSSTGVNNNPEVNNTGDNNNGINAGGGGFRGGQTWIAPANKSAKTASSASPLLLSSFRSNPTSTSNVNLTASGGISLNNNNSNNNEAPPSKESPSSRNSRMRLAAYNEMLSTERLYYMSIKKLHALFFMPLKNPQTAIPPLDFDASALISHTQIHSLVSSLTVIINLTKEMLSGFEKDKKGEKIVENFKGMVPCLKMYQNYINVYDEAVEELCRWNREGGEKYKNFVTKFLRDNGGQMDLSFFLILPIQRLCRYEMLLQAIAKYMDSDTEQSAKIEQVIEEVKKVNGLINEKKKEDKIRRKMMMIQSKLVITNKECLIDSSIAKDIVIVNNTNAVNNSDGENHVHNNEGLNLNDENLNVANLEIDLISNTRRIYIREGVMSEVVGGMSFQVGQQKIMINKYVFIMFNDIVLKTRRRIVNGNALGNFLGGGDMGGGGFATSGNWNYELMETMWIEDLDVFDLQQVQQGLMNVILITNKKEKKKSWMLSCASDEEKKSWIEDLQNAVQVQSLLKT